MWLEIFKWLTDIYLDYRKSNEFKDIAEEGSVLFNESKDYKKLVESGRAKDKDFQDYINRKPRKTLKKFLEELAWEKNHKNKKKGWLPDVIGPTFNIKAELIKLLKGATSEDIEQFIKAMARVDEKWNKREYNEFFWDRLDKMQLSTKGLEQYLEELDDFEQGGSNVDATSYFLIDDEHSDRGIEELIINGGNEETMFSFDIQIKFQKSVRYYTYYDVPFAIIVVMISYEMIERLPSNYMMGALYFFTYAWTKDLPKNNKEVS